MLSSLIIQDSALPIVRSARTRLPQKAGSKCDNGIPLFLHLCFQKREAFTEFFFKTFDPFPQRSPLFAAALGVPVGLVGRAYLVLQWDIWKKQPVSTLITVQVAFLLIPPFLPRYTRRRRWPQCACRRTPWCIPPSDGRCCHRIHFGGRLFL